MQASEGAAYDSNIYISPESPGRAVHPCALGYSMLTCPASQAGQRRRWTSLSSFRQMGALPGGGSRCLGSSPHQRPVEEGLRCTGYNFRRLEDWRSAMLEGPLRCGGVIAQAFGALLSRQNQVRDAALNVRAEPTPGATHAVVHRGDDAAPTPAPMPLRLHDSDDLASALLTWLSEYEGEPLRYPEVFAEYCEMCLAYDFVVRPWNPVARAFTLLTTGRKIYRWFRFDDGTLHRLRVYPIVTGAKSQLLDASVSIRCPPDLSNSRIARHRLHQIQPPAAPRRAA